MRRASSQTSYWTVLPFAEPIHPFVWSIPYVLPWRKFTYVLIESSIIVNGWVLWKQHRIEMSCMISSIEGQWSATWFRKRLIRYHGYCWTNTFHYAFKNFWKRVLCKLIDISTSLWLARIIRGDAVPSSRFTSEDHWSFSTLQFEPTICVFLIELKKKS